jgi:two-component system, NarL family, sensor histidine kinase LiaS
VLDNSTPRPVVHSFRNIKWYVLRYTVIATAITAAAGLLDTYYSASYLFGVPWWSVWVGAALLSGLIVGYMVGLRLHREIDLFHLTLLQWNQGRLSERITSSRSSPLYLLAQDLNGYTDSMEERLKALRKAAEEQQVGQQETAETAVQEERRRLARDLHDTVSQQLFALHMSASALPKLLQRDEPEAVNAMVEQLVRMSQAAQKQMRGLIAQLRPMELEGKSLKEALEKWFPDYCNQNGLQGSLDLRLENDGRLSDALERHFFLIIQEAMANVVKHARASRASLSLQDRGDLVMLSLADDGQGFSGQEVGTASYGLHTMRERAQKLGGTLEIASKPGEGTTIQVRIPKL